jgi:hypothetical protein
VPLGYGARLQANSGTITGTGFTATLPNPTTAGSALLLFFASNGASPQFPVIDPPWIQEDAQGGNWYRWRRDRQPAGGTSWTVGASTSTPYCWRVEEWAGLSTIGQPDAQAGHSQAGGTVTADTGTAIADIPDFAALAMFRAGSSGTFAFPAGHSYSSGWAQVDALQQGTGTTPGDFMLLFAESYPDAAGSVSSTVTWDTTGGGSFANVAVYGSVACYRPDVRVPFGVLTA